jgi:hypothetical protein
MAQDWITTLDHDFGGVHPDTAASLRRFFEALRSGFAGPSAPATPSVGQTWVDTTGGATVPKVWDGAAWRIVRPEPVATAPIAGVTRQLVLPGSGSGDLTIFESISELLEMYRVRHPLADSSLYQMRRSVALLDGYLRRPATVEDLTADTISRWVMPRASRLTAAGPMPARSSLLGGPLRVFAVMRFPPC